MKLLRPFLTLMFIWLLLAAAVFGAGLIARGALEAFRFGWRLPEIVNPKS